MPSVLDGTERIIEPDDKLPLPEEITWRNIMPPVRNQGTSQTCVCQSLTCMLDYMVNLRNATPGKCNNFSINELYNQRTDKRLEGMTFKDALRYLKKHGLSGATIDGYGKVNSVEAAKYALVMFGPIAIGLPAFGNGQAFWRKTGPSKGGHAVVLCGYNKEGFVLRNSWGEGWADRGYTLITYKDFLANCFEAWTFLL